MLNILNTVKNYIIIKFNSLIFGKYSGRECSKCTKVMCAFYVIIFRVWENFECSKSIIFYLDSFWAVAQTAISCYSRGARVKCTHWLYKTTRCWKYRWRSTEQTPFQHHAQAATDESWCGPYPGATRAPLVGTQPCRCGTKLLSCIAVTKATRLTQKIRRVLHIR